MGSSSRPAAGAGAFASRVAVFGALLLGLLLCIGGSWPRAANAATAQETAVNPRQTWQLLDYLAVDYAGAVQGGEVIDASEYAEMREFAATVREQLAALPATEGQAALRTQADRLVAAIEAKRDPDAVADLAHGMADDLLASYPVGAVPATAPDPARAAPLYAQQCAACHGSTGQGDGPLAAALDPPAIAFTDAHRAARRSVFGLYEVISQGVEGTSMGSFASLPEADRWALAFHVGGMAYSDEDRATGKAMWRDGDAGLHGELPSLEALTRSSQADLAKRLDAAQARAITAYLRAEPAAVDVRTAGGDAARPFALARQRLSDSVDAYRAGNATQAKTFALSAYLDGVEPVEPALAARDRDLMHAIEAEMGSFRSQLGGNTPADAIQAQANRIGTLLDRAEFALGNSASDRLASFLGSFTILLREGLEALLIVIGMIAFLRKAERRDALPYVHAGWLGALAAGVLTWVAATYMINISGANRELTEGLSALFAAAVLLSVGIWMHQKSIAGRWQRYLHAKMSAAMTRRSAIFLFTLAFVAVYREVFETILFYIAMWNQDNGGAILAGLAAGSVALAVVAWWMLRVSVRLPIARFFSISSILIAVLAVVLVGKGIAALQEAGWVPMALVAVPRVEWLGVYPSWQSLLAQCAVAVLAIIGFAINARTGRTLRAAVEP